MAERVIEYGPPFIVWEGKTGQNVHIYPCHECGVVVSNRKKHTQFHNVGR